MAGSNHKQHIRQALLEKRQNLPEKDYRHYSSLIREKLIESDCFKQADVVHCYVSMNERHEVDTHPLIKRMLAGPKKVVVPVMQAEQGVLKHMQLNDFDDLRPNQWQVPEPAGGNEVSVSRLDLVIVPMAGGDGSKNRMGYGGGYYDRFLKDVSCPCVGLLFEACLVDSLPVESFDVPMTKVITEKQIMS